MHQQMVRDKIQASQLINALQDHVLKKRKMLNTQVRAALGLLSKCVPDLQRTELTGRDGVPLEVQVVRYSDVVLAHPVAEQLEATAIPDGSLESSGTGLPPRRTLSSPTRG